MQFKKNGVSINVPDALVIDYALRALADEERPFERKVADPIDPAPAHLVPPIGSMWLAEGGIYAGVIRGVDGKSDCHVVLGEEYDGQLTWDKAKEWAGHLVTLEFSDWSLPTRKEQSLLFANLGDHFKEQYYWAGEQHAAYESYAWDQYFGYGSQGHWLKDNELRARAVRRFSI